MSEVIGHPLEIALNHAARKWGKGMGYEIVTGLKHVIKEKKYDIKSLHSYNFLYNCLNITFWNSAKAGFSITIDSSVLRSMRASLCPYTI